MNTLVAQPIRTGPGLERQVAVTRARVRLIGIAALFALGMSLIVLKLVYYGLGGTGEFGPAAHTGLVTARADITDRNGVPLAQTIDAWSVAVRPGALINPPAELAPRLHDLMPERSTAEYLRLLTGKRRFVYLRRRAMPDLIARVNALGETGIAIEAEPERLYPQATLAAHVLGYNNIDNHGLAGMERVLDDRLIDPARLDEPVALTIDTRVQAAMESELYGAMVRQRAIGATGVVLDAATGEVVALASLPVFNPNKIDGSPVEARRNNVTQSVYELGSTFKPLTIARALDNGSTTLQRRYDATAPLAIGRFHISDDHAQRRWLNPVETLIHSSNIATARIADGQGAGEMQALFRSLGFDEPAHIELKERGAPLWPQHWARVTTMTTGYGHGIAVSPLHLATAYAALVNGGLWRPATLLRVPPGHVARGRRVFSAHTSDVMRSLLRLNVLEGTGKNAEAPGFRVGGKTGTAEKAGVGGYSRSKNVSTFAAAFPMDAPRYVVIAMLDAPQGSSESYGLTTAGWTAAPVVGRVVSRIGPMLGVYPDTRREPELATYRALLWKPKGER